MLLNFVAMLRVSGLDLNQSDHSDQVKKLLKYVADISRKIEERHQSADRVEDVFSVELLNLRIRMRDFVLKILSLDPSKSGMKVMEQFWSQCERSRSSTCNCTNGSE